MGSRVALLALALAACESGATSFGDAGSPDAWPLGPGAPQLTPCPPGWRETTDARGLVVCDPWPVGGRHDDCAPHEVHLPGASACTRVGSVCAPDGWPADLPTDRTIVFVDDDAPAGGDGTSRATAFRSIGDATIVLTSGVIAVATGTYDERFTLLDGQELRGACTEHTRLTHTASAPANALVSLAGTATLSNVTIDAPETAGIGLRGAGAVVRDVIVRGAIPAGLVAISGSLTASGLVIEDTRPLADGRLGRGLDVHGGAEVTLERSAILGSWELGAIAQGASLTLRDVLIADTRDASHAGSGRGLSAGEGATLRAERLVVERNVEIGVLVATGASATIDDLVVRDVAPGLSQVAQGIQLTTAGTSTFQRVQIEGASSGGLRVAGSTAVVRDLVVRDPRALGPLAEAVCVYVHEGARLTLDRADLDRCFGAGLGSDGVGTLLAATDVRAHDVASIGTTGELGLGAWASYGGAITLERARIERVRFAGVGSTAGSLDAHDLVVSEVAASGCAPGSCAHALEGGFGVVSNEGAHVALSDFVLEQSALCGAVVGADGTLPTDLELRSGIVASAPVGACVQIPGFDVERLHAGVTYRDVDVPLAATSYALPAGI